MSDDDYSDPDSDLPEDERSRLLARDADVRSRQADFERAHKTIFCACRFERAEGLLSTTPVELCGFHAEQARKLAAATKAIQDLGGYFRSGNSIAIERASITTADFLRITGAVSDLT